MESVNAARERGELAPPIFPTGLEQPIPRMASEPFQWIRDRGPMATHGDHGSFTTATRLTESLSTSRDTGTPATVVSVASSSVNGGRVTTPAINLLTFEWSNFIDKIKDIYENEEDEGLFDCLIRQDKRRFVFFDVKYTHVGDWMQVKLPRLPVQICLMDWEGQVIYAAKLRMMDPHLNDKPITTGDEYLDALQTYVTTLESGSRWSRPGSFSAAAAIGIETFNETSAQIPHRTLEEMRNDIRKMDLRQKVFFTWDRYNRSYNILRILSPLLPPRILTFCGSKIMHQFFPNLTRNLYDLIPSIVDFHGRPVLKYNAVQDAWYNLQIFSVIIKGWEMMQKQPTGRPFYDPQRSSLVDVFEAFRVDSPLLNEPIDFSDPEDEKAHRKYPQI